jgi:hypothetical protein
MSYREKINPGEKGKLFDERKSDKKEKNVTQPNQKSIK